MVTVASGNDVQTVTISGSPTGGSFKLTYNGQTTAAIAYNASASAVQSALGVLPNIGSGNVLVSGSGPWVATFSGALGSLWQPLLSADYSLLTGGTSPAVAIAHTTPGALQYSYMAYASGNSDGSQTAVGILALDASTDNQGRVTYSAASSAGDEHGQFQASAPMYYKGEFRTSDLAGLDSGAVTALGRLIAGSLASGVLSLK